MDGKSEMASTRRRARDSSPLRSIAKGIPLGLEDDAFDVDAACGDVDLDDPTPRALHFGKAKMTPPVPSTSDASYSADTDPRATPQSKAGVSKLGILRNGAGQGDAAVVEKEQLFEIKPRVREQEDAAREPRPTLDHSAFDELPPADVYDPAWNLSPLRAEAGQLGKGKGDDGDRRRPTTSGPVLPGAFTLTSSADLDDDDEEDTEGNGRQNVGFQEERDRSGSVTTGTLVSADFELAETADVSSTSLHLKSMSMGRLGLGSMSFLGRKKTSPLANDPVLTSRHLFMTNETVEAVMQLLQFILRSNYGAIDLMTSTRGRPELRSKIRISTEDNSHVTFAIVMNADFNPPDAVPGVHVSMRRSKGDKAKVSSESLRRFCVTLVARYRNASTNATVTVLGNTDVANKIQFPL
jgi:hypothetical protein